MVTNDDRRPSDVFRQFLEVSTVYTGKDQDSDKMQEHAVVKVKMTENIVKKFLDHQEHVPWMKK